MSDSGDRVLAVGLALLIFASGAGAGLSLGGVGSTSVLSSQLTPTPSSPTTVDLSGRRNISSGTEISFDATCFNYTQLNGEHREDCHASVFLTAMGDEAAFIEIRAVTFFGDTETWTLYEDKWPMLITEVDDGGQTFELERGDFVAVEAVYHNGSRRLLWRHQFSCSDIEVGDPC